jgi:hypothetical protein
VLSYKTNDLTYIDVVFEAHSFEELVSRLRLVRTLIGSDNDLVAELEATRAEVEREKVEIAEKEQEVSDLVQELEEQNDRLLALQAEQQAQRAEAQAARAEKRSALVAVEKNLKELEAGGGAPRPQPRAESVISGGSSSGGGSGQLIWPCSGVVTSLRLAHPPDPRHQDLPHRHRHRRPLRHADQGGRQRQGDHGLLVRRLRQLQHRRPRRRPLDPLRAPELDDRLVRPGRLARPGDRVRRLDGPLDGPASALRDAGQWAAGRPDEVSSLGSPFFR